MVQEDGSETGTCPRCGGIGCATCSRPTDAAGFLLLRGGGDTGESPVKLVREFKGPSVRDLLHADPEELDLLPGRVRAMAMALEDEDLAEAERRIDRALGSILPGPTPTRGRRRRRPVWIAIVACVAAAATVWLCTRLVGG
jgi:hypothetical protein